MYVLWDGLELKVIPSPFTCSLSLSLLTLSSLSLSLHDVSCFMFHVILSHELFLLSYPYLVLFCSKVRLLEGQKAGLAPRCFFIQFMVSLTLYLLLTPTYSHWSVCLNDIYAAQPQPKRYIVNLVCWIAWRYSNSLIGTSISCTIAPSMTSYIALSQRILYNFGQIKQLSL